MPPKRWRGQRDAAAPFCEILHDFEGRHVDEDQGKEAVRKDQTVFHIFLRQGSDIDRGMEDTKQQTLPGRAVPFRAGRNAPLRPGQSDCQGGV